MSRFVFVLGAGASAAANAPLASNFMRSRDHGLNNIEALVAEWSRKLPLPAETIHSYLTTNIHYVLDEECIEGMKGFFRMAAECAVLPGYDLSLSELVSYDS